MQTIKWFLLGAGLTFYLEKLNDDIFIAFHRHLDWWVAIKEIYFPSLYDFAYFSQFNPSKKSSAKVEI